jgi:hypothetical protein
VLALERSGDEGCAFATAVLGEQSFGRLPDDVSRLVAVEASSAEVPPGDRAAPVDAEDGVVGGIEDGGEELAFVPGAVRSGGVGVLGDRVNLRHSSNWG